MKKLSIISIMLVFLIFGCSSNKEKNTDENKTMNKSENTVNNNTAKMVKPESKSQVSSNDIMKHAGMYNGTMTEDAIIISGFKHSKPLHFEGSNAKAITMPDGSLWEVKKVDGKNMLVMPDGKLVEEKMVDGKMKLITSDNKTYNIEMMDGKMVALNSNYHNKNVASK